MLIVSDRREVESDANFLLDNFGVTKPPVPIFEIIKNNLPDSKILTDRLITGFRGCAFPTDENNMSKWFITLSSRYGYEVRRFTAAHEFRHVLEGKQGFSTTKDVKTSVARDTEEERQRIDYFAACILMPEKLIREAWGNFLYIRKPTKDRIFNRVKRLAQLFQVSRQSMLIRLKRLGIIHPLVAEELLSLY